MIRGWRSTFGPEAERWRRLRETPGDHLPEVENIAAESGLDPVHCTPIRGLTVRWKLDCRVKAKGQRIFQTKGEGGDQMKVFL